MKQLKENMLALMSKLEKISKISKPNGDGEDFIGIEIDENGITYNSESYYSGCGEERYSFCISWDEIEQPHEYFLEKYKKEWEKYIEAQKLYKENEKKIEEEKRRKQYEKLKEEFGN